MAAMQKTQEPRKTFGYYLPVALAIKLRRRAKQRRRSDSQELAVILTKALAKIAA